MNLLKRNYLTMHIDLDAAKLQKSIAESKSEIGYLHICFGKAPELCIEGKSYPVSQLSYQYVTDSRESGTNMISATYIDTDNGITNEVMINNKTGKIAYINVYK